MSPGERILKMMKELDGMRGQAVLQELRRLDLSAFILDTNYAELKTLITRLATDPQAQSLMYLKNHDQFEFAMMQ